MRQAHPEREYYYVHTRRAELNIRERHFRQAKVQAARDGLALRDLFVRGLQLALQTPPAVPPKSKANFPFIHASENAPV